jgi:hypothetical protein
MAKLFAASAARLSRALKRDSLVEHYRNGNAVLARRVIGGGFIAGLMLLGLAFAIVI